MKPSHASRPAQCPFCKSSFYAIEYHGARIEEEKSLEQAEEQKVIEEKIRMRSESPIEESLMPANQSQTLLELLHPFPVVEGPSSEQGEESEITQVQMYRQQETIDGDGSSYPNMFPTRAFCMDVKPRITKESMDKSKIWKLTEINEPAQCRSLRLMDNLRPSKVIVADNYFTGSKDNLKKWNGHPRFELIRHDVTEPLLVGVDQIYHLAYPASPIFYKYNPVKIHSSEESIGTRILSSSRPTNIGT